MKIPNKVKIGYREYSIELLPENEVHVEGVFKWGSVNANTAEIKISSDNSHPGITLLHEIVHAIDVMSGEETLEESEVEMISLGIWGTLRDNPDVRKYILDNS